MLDSMSDTYCTAILKGTGIHVAVQAVCRSSCGVKGWTVVREQLLASSASAVCRTSSLLNLAEIAQSLGSFADKADPE